MPREFPHKKYEWVALEDRLELLKAATAGDPRFSVGVSGGGLFIEIAGECREAYGPKTELWFLCGRDAADRIVNWDYGEAGAFEKQLETFGLLVADRDGRYDPPAAMRGRIFHLALDDNYDGVSATAVRQAIREGRDWAHLVPEEIVPEVKRLYEHRPPD